MLTRQEFRALVRDVNAASPHDRARVLARPQAAQRLTPADAAHLTGMAEDTLRQYERRARQDVPGRRGGWRWTIPPRRPDGTWLSGDLAAWLAERPATRRKPPPKERTREPRPPAKSDEELLPAVRAILRAEAKGIPAMHVSALRAYLAEQGIHVEWARAARLLRAARAARKPLESGRPDGLVTATQLARWAGVTKPAITRQVNLGKLAPVKREDGLLLFNPAAVTLPGGALRTPVDLPHEDEAASA